MVFHRPPSSEVVSLVASLHRSGFSNPSVLQLVADRWRTYELDEHAHVNCLRDEVEKTLVDMERAGLLTTTEQSDISTIVNHWPYPMHSLDLSETEVKKKLEEIQRNWCPDW
jgi:hypothetical protein